MSERAPRTRTFRPPDLDYEFRVIGDERHPLRDFYHGLLLLSWPSTLALVAGGFLGLNAVFAIAYAETGGVGHARPGSFADAFFFSVQTLGTIGYGAMYPETTAANVLVVLQSLVGLLFMALVTGLVFAKFSRPTARVVFTREAVVSPMDGVPTLAARLGNERGNAIVDARVRLVLTRTERTKEGVTMYRSYDLPLVRDHVLSLNRSFSVMHRIDAASPLFDRSRDRFVAEESELTVLVVGIDDTVMQTVHALHRYIAGRVLWGARHVDVLSESADAITLDLRRFHDTEPTNRTDDFPYPPGQSQ